MSVDAGIRTTVTIREDLYQQLKRRAGNLSDALNEILAREFERDHSLFGADRGRRRDLEEVRDHRDRV